MKKRSGKPGRPRKPVPRQSLRRASSARTAVRKGLFLVGFMGAGKTSVGRALAELLNWTFEDLDDRIEGLEGHTVAEIFRELGEPAFRRAERAALAQLLAELHAGAAKIVALGGGAFVQPGIAAMLKKSGVPTVFLDAPVEELWRRCCDDRASLIRQSEVRNSKDRPRVGGHGKPRTERPLLKGLDQFRQLYATRRKLYLTASLRVDTAGQTVDAVAAVIAEMMGLHTIARTE